MFCCPAIFRPQFSRQPNPVKSPTPTRRKPHAKARHTLSFHLQSERAFLSTNLLVRGIAHDFSNVIAGILGSAELLRLDSPPALANHPSLAEIFQTGARANEMVRLLNYFSQRSPSQRTLVSLLPVLEGALEILRANLPAAVEISHRLDRATPAILADAAQIQQVVISLCTNASHSLTGGKGKIEVRLESCDVEAGLAAQVGLCRGPYVRISIHDNGDHFTKRMLARLFEPFACKRPTGHNSGLELFAAREIVHAHEGEITVASAPGEGTVFQIYFPVPPQR